MAFRPKIVTTPAPPDSSDDPNSPDYKVDPSVKATKPAAPTPPPGTAGPYGDDLTAPGVDPNAPDAPASTNGEPAYDAANPDPWIIYNYKIGNNGQTPDAAQLDYWHKKLASGEITGTGQPADYNYWGTRLRRQGVDDLNPQGAQAKPRGYLDAANQYGGLFGQGGISGFLGGSLVPTDAGAFQTLQQRIQDILGGGGGLDSRPISSAVAAGAPEGSAAGSSSSSAVPIGAPATAQAANAAPPSITPTMAPPSAAPSGGTALDADTKSRNAAILGSLLTPKGATNDAVAGGVANQGASVIPDRAAGALTSIFGLSPILAAGNAMQRFNRGVEGTPAGLPTGPNDPNLQPTTPEEQARNAAILGQLLSQNEANGGI